MFKNKKIHVNKFSWVTTISGMNDNLFKLINLFFQSVSFLKRFIYLFLERGREHEQEGQGEGKGENLKQTLYSAWSPMRGSIP